MQYFSYVFTAFAASQNTESLLFGDSSIDNISMNFHMVWASFSLLDCYILKIIGKIYRSIDLLFW